jgi:pyrimidine operon attenuation protein / uracil phosphoribosyltransferase
MTKTLLLDEKQVTQRLNRLAYQIYEDNADETSILLAGIMKNGFLVAEKLSTILRSISPLKIQLVEVTLNKRAQFSNEITLDIQNEDLQGKSVVLVDDVLNSGKTMMYALKPFLAADIKKIRTVVLVDRSHKRYPVAADFAGLSLATTMGEHVSVEFENGRAEAYLL